MLVELSRREKEAGIKPNPEIDAFTKAIAVSGQETSLITNYVLKKADRWRKCLICILHQNLPKKTTFGFGTIHLPRRSMLLSKKDTKTYLYQSISLIPKMRYHIQFGLLYMLPSARILFHFSGTLLVLS
ncbi:ABC transporter G family member 34 [Camellia lanceoleosa]|uniref:ABC transporter G family member 34 n=1 Tax=Camellia lanceoleosa TaxID=1840588 RepID=A0ACC0H9V6_9ERIC|nr:ABC transporter G family member 34 [Camellia lanceoleosa]